MLNILKQNRDKLRTAVRSAVLDQCIAILGDSVKYQIEGLIGITELDADDVIIVNLIHDHSKAADQKSDDGVLNKDSTALAEGQTQLDDNLEPISDLLDGQEDTNQENLPDSLFPDSSYEFNMKQELGGETLSLSVESFDDSFTDINMSTSESSTGSLSDATKQTEVTEDESEVRTNCDKENHDMSNVYDRDLQTPEPCETKDTTTSDPVGDNIKTETTNTSENKSEDDTSKKPTKMQRYRFKVKHHLPEKYQEQKQRDAERVRNRRRLRQSQMTEEERQRQRERWRDKKRKQRLKRKLIKDSKSESEQMDGEDVHQTPQKCQSTAKKSPDKHTPTKHDVKQECPTPVNTSIINVNTPKLITQSPNVQPANLLSPPENDPLRSPPFRVLGTVTTQTPVSTWNMPTTSMSCDRKPGVNVASPDWHKEPTSCPLPMITPFSTINSLTNNTRPSFSSGQLNTQPLFDLTRDDCHVRPQFKMPPSLPGSHRPLSHGPPMSSYSMSSGPSYPMLGGPYSNAQSSFYNDHTGFKSPYIKPEPGIGDCCNLTGPGTQINPYLGYKPFNNSASLHGSWDQSSMTGLDMPFIKQEPVSAYNNWL